MGLPEIWAQLGDGEVTSIAGYSADHFERTGAPLRIAVDEAGWRYNNLSAAEVAKIREKVPAANPIEKAILYRVVGLLKLNIQLVFVFDGPTRPWKKGRRTSSVRPKDTDLLKKMLTNLGVPCYEAPGEAEAECAKLQQLGLVDAIWTEDADALMFDCTTLMRFHHQSTGDRFSKSNTHFRVYRSAWVQEKLGLDKEDLVLRECLVLFAILVRGDYNIRGLPGCGMKHALEVIRQAPNLAHRICEVLEADIPRWRGQLYGSFKKTGSSIKVPHDFPRYQDVLNYRAPKVSSLDRLQAQRELLGLLPIERNEPALVRWNLPVFEGAKEGLRCFLDKYRKLHQVKKLVTSATNSNALPSASRMG